MPVPYLKCMYRAGIMRVFDSPEAIEGARADGWTDHPADVSAGIEAIREAGEIGERVGVESTLGTVESASETPSEPPKRRRGRPPKVRTDE